MILGDGARPQYQYLAEQFPFRISDWPLTLSMYEQRADNPIMISNGCSADIAELCPLQRDSV